MPQLKLPAVFTDHAVLQHSQMIKVWGWTDPGTRVSVAFRGHHASATAVADGRFEVELHTQTPGGPFEMVFHCGDDVTTLHDILVGEVWLCSGQSNMEWPLRESDGAEAELPQSRNPRIRLLHVPQVTAEAPAADVSAKWACCTPESAAAFSGVAYHFGKVLNENLDVPIGLIQSAWGGTTCEAWTSRQALSAEPSLRYLAEQREAFGPHEDPGISQEAVDWMTPDLDESAWSTMQIPQAWERTGLNIDGAVWFRRSVEIPERWAGKALELHLDTLDDLDRTYFNGTQVGAIGTETPNWWAVPRVYTIPAASVVAGRAVIATRIFDLWGDGGFTGKPQNIFIAPADDPSDRISLAGQWLYRVELALEPRSPATAVQSMGLFNAMIHPLAPYAIAGTIWYQGESNVDRAFEYRTLFPAMIRSWRETWGSDFAFLFVLLAGWHAHSTDPCESKIAELRDAQLAALALPKTAAASAVDLGDIEDIHPRNKKDVGNRLARAALATCYHRLVEPSGPVLDRITISGTETCLEFSHADGLHSRGSQPAGFAVADESDEFVWGDVRIDGTNVILRHPDGRPVRYVRYNWADNPVGNLYNSAGLPMQPFRTDSRAYTTAPAAEEYGRLG